MAEISKICFSNPQKANSSVKCYHLISPTLQKKLLGEILFLIQIRIPENLEKNASTLTEEISEIIINGLRTNYYTPENLKESENIETILENALQKVNRLLYQEVISSKIFERFIKNTNALISVIKGDEVYFSLAKDARAFILRKNKIINLISGEEKNYQTPAKTFAQIISGNLEKEDVLIFSTDNFLDYFTFEKLRENILKHPSKEISRNLEKILENLKEKISLGAFLIKKEEKKIPEIVPEKIEEKIPTKILVQPSEEKVKEIIIKEKIPIAQKPIKKPVIKLKLPKISFAFLPLLFKSFPSLFRKISLPRPKLKLAPLIIIILIILLAYNFIQGKIREKQTIKFFLSLQEIQEKNALLKASLAYGDKKKSFVLAEELKEKINLLKPKTSIEKEILENIKKDFKENIGKIYNLQRIKEPKIIADFSLLDKKAEILNLIRQENSFFVLNQRIGEIYEFNQETNKVSSLAKTDLVIKKLFSYTREELILASDNQIQLLNLKNKKISPFKIETRQKELFIGDLKIYDKKLYLLDNKNNQIFKYLKTVDGFGQEVSWFKEKVNLKDVVSFSIDGSIYLLKQKEILKFYLGKKVILNLEKVYPVLEKAEKIFTEIDFKNIYLLEPTNQRIIIFDKTGKLVKQITSDKFTDLKDLSVNEKETKIWLLNGTEVMEIGF